MGKATNNQKSDKALRDKILQGIIDTDIQASVSIFCEETKARFVLDETYEDFKSRHDGLIDTDMIEVKTFTWTGERNDRMQVFNTSIRKDQILEISEVTEDMWVRFITDATDRAMMANMQGQGIAIN